MDEARVAAAIALTSADRSTMIRSFFEWHPGADRPPGLGRALIDFVDWLTASGRLHDSHGSDWWKALNGSLILDLGAVMDAEPCEGEAGPGVSAWREYAALGPAPDVRALQAALWRAHQVSLHDAMPATWGLLDAEPEHERDFIEVAMEIVDLAALHRQRTDTAGLAESTRRLYPDHYPLTAPYGDDLAQVRAASLRAHSGPVVGLSSEIWTSRRQAS